MSGGAPMNSPTITTPDLRALWKLFGLCPSGALAGGSLHDVARQKTAGDEEHRPA